MAWKLGDEKLRSAALTCTRGGGKQEVGSGREGMRGRKGREEGPGAPRG